MLRRSLCLIIGLILLGCENKKLIIKQIVNGNITLCWYRESYIEDTRAFVSLKINNEETVVLSNGDTDITDIELKKDTVIIKVDDIKNAGIYGRKDRVGNYRIILKEVSEEEWWKHYHPGEKYYPDRIKKPTN